jgi:hypothetical protein
MRKREKNAGKRVFGKVLRAPKKSLSKTTS